MGKYSIYSIDLPTWEHAYPSAPAPVIHSLRTSLGLYLSEDRSSGAGTSGAATGTSGAATGTSGARTSPTAATAAAAMLHVNAQHQLPDQQQLSQQPSQQQQPLAVRAFDNQSYTLRVRFTAPLSGWSFEEQLDVELERSNARAGYHGRLDIERPDLPFAAGENLSVAVVQADWHGVTFGDWRGMHAVLWETELCGVPQVS